MGKDQTVKENFSCFSTTLVCMSLHVYTSVCEQHSIHILSAFYMQYLDHKNSMMASKEPASLPLLVLQAGLIRYCIPWQSEGLEEGTM